MGILETTCDPTHYWVIITVSCILSAIYMSFANDSDDDDTGGPTAKTGYVI